MRETSIALASKGLKTGGALQLPMRADDVGANRIGFSVQSRIGPAFTHFLRSTHLTFLDVYR